MSYFQTTSIAPKVYLEEVDQSTALLNPSNSITLFVGDFERGPINKPLYITKISELELYFGEPTKDNYNEWYQVYNFLTYTSGIFVCRTGSSKMTSATNDVVSANSPGTWGNNLKVYIYNQEDWNNNLETPSGNLQELIIKDKSEGYHIFVYYKEILTETFISIEKIEDILSDYIIISNLITGEYPLGNGVYGQSTILDFRESYNLFTKEDYIIDIIIGNPKLNDLAIELAEYRKDCIAFLAPSENFVSTLNVNDDILITENGFIVVLSSENIAYTLSENLEDYVKSLQKSEYALLAIGYKQIFDKYSGKKKIVSIAGDLAGLKSLAAKENPWNINAGIERGTIKNYINLKSIKDKDRVNNFYRLGANILENGTLMSQKLLVEKSKVEKLNVRNVLNYLERTCESVSKNFIFEFNTRQNRYILMTEIKRVLDDVLNSGGIEAGKVIVKPDSENTIIINIYIKFYYIAEFVNLRITNAGTKQFSEVFTAN